MVSVDANILIYAYDENCAQYERARVWMQSVFSSEPDIGVPFQSILAFLRVTTNSKLLRKPFALDTALAIVDSWLSRSNVILLVPGPNHWRIFKNLAAGAQVTSRLATDAHIAALAIEHDATLYSADRDFARFSGLRWINPLAK